MERELRRRETARGRYLSSLAVGIPAQEEGRGELGQLHGKPKSAYEIRTVLAQGYFATKWGWWLGGLSGREDRKCAAKHDNSQQAENQAAIAFGLGR